MSRWCDNSSPNVTLLHVGLGEMTALCIPLLLPRLDDAGMLSAIQFNPVCFLDTPPSAIIQHAFFLLAVRRYIEREEFSNPFQRHRIMLSTKLA